MPDLPRRLGTVGLSIHLTYPGFQGDPTHSETGLVDMMTRYYLPGLGRFTTRDVVMGDPLDPASLNQFGYGVNAPITFTDPTGMCPVDRDCPPPASFTRREREAWYGYQAEHPPTYYPDPIPIPPPAPGCHARCGFTAPSFEAPEVSLDPACPAGCAGGWTGFLYQLVSTGATCASFDFNACVSGGSGLGIRAIEDTVGGGECVYSPVGDITTCTGVTRTWVTPVGPGFTVGHTVTYDDGFQVTSDIQRHEINHSAQSDALGPAYVPAYLAALGVSFGISGENDCNAFEMLAGSEEGGYAPCDPGF